MKVCVFACLHTAGGALLDFGESMKKLSESKNALDINVKHNFIDPLQIVVDQNIKDVQVEAASVFDALYSSLNVILITVIVLASAPLQHHLKKMEGRRLDYDYKKKRQGKIPDEDIHVAQEKFNESKELSGKAMVSLLELDVSNLCN